MPKKRFRPEEIIGKLRHADVLLGQGKRIAEIVKVLGITDVTYYRWRQRVRRDDHRPGETPERGWSARTASSGASPISPSTNGSSRRPPRETAEPLPPPGLCGRGVRGARVSERRACQVLGPAPGHAAAPAGDAAAR